jgi:hypothetical protein
MGFTSSKPTQGPTSNPTSNPTIYRKDIDNEVDKFLALIEKEKNLHLYSNRNVNDRIVSEVYNKYKEFLKTADDFTQLFNNYEGPDKYYNESMQRLLFTRNAESMMFNCNQTSSGYVFPYSTLSSDELLVLKNADDWMKNSKGVKYTVV